MIPQQFYPWLVYMKLKISNIILWLLFLITPAIAINLDSGFDKGKLPANQITPDCSQWSKNLSCAQGDQQSVDNVLDQLSGGGGSAWTITDGTHSIANVSQLTVTGGTVGGSTPNATLTISGPYTKSFTNANLSSGILSVAHDLSSEYVLVQVYNSSLNMIQPDFVQLVDSNDLTVNLSSFGTISGTWYLVVSSGNSSNNSLSSPFGTTINGTSGGVIPTGIQGIIRIPYNAVITGWYLSSTTSGGGSAVVDIWEVTSANIGAPSSAYSITASNPPTLSSANVASDTTLTGWSKTLTTGEYLIYNVNSASTVTNLQLQVMVNRTS